jgi:hypothetical protein
VFGHTLRINPLIVIFALLLGAQLYGILGALVSLPVAAVIRETIVYLRRHLVLDPWGPEPALAGAMGEGPARPRCPECGAEHEPDDAYCGRCGASLAPRVGAPS